MQANNKEKANVLLQIIGVGKELAELELAEQETYSERQAIGRIADQKKKFAKEQENFPDAPKELVSPSELIRQQQEILAKNGENQRKRENVTIIERNLILLDSQIEQQEQKIKEEQAKLEEIRTKRSNMNRELQIARMDAIDLQDESTEELERNIANIDEINRKVRINLDKEKAEDDAKEYVNQYNALTDKLTKIREAKSNLLTNAELPLEGLSVEDGELTYKGQKWDNMSGSEQLIVSTAIVRRLNPNCGFVLLDKLEQMDMNIGRILFMAEAEGLNNSHKSKWG